MKKIRTAILLTAITLVLTGCSDKEKDEPTTTESSTGETATIATVTEVDTEDMEIVASGEKKEGDYAPIEEFDDMYNPTITGANIVDGFNQTGFCSALVDYMSDREITLKCEKAAFIEKDPGGQGGYLAELTMSDGSVIQVQVFNTIKWIISEYIGDMYKGDGGMTDADEVNSPADARKDKDGR